VIKLERQNKDIPKTYILYGPPFSGKEHTALNFFKEINNEKTITIDSPNVYPIITSIDRQRLKKIINEFKKNNEIKKILIDQIRKLNIYLKIISYTKKTSEIEKNIEILENAKNIDENIDKIEKIVENIEYTKIPLEFIRDTLKQLYVKSSKYKLLIIKYIEEIDTIGLNTLLKTIEESPEKLITIMIARKIEKVLPTIRSRAIKLYIRKLSKEESINEIIYFEDEKYKNIEIENMDYREIKELIDYIKSFFPTFSPYDIQILKYLNTLKEAIEFNTNIEYIKEAIKIFIDKIKIIC